MIIWALGKCGTPLLVNSQDKVAAPDRLEEYSAANLRPPRTATLNELAAQACQAKGCIDHMFLTTPDFATTHFPQVQAKRAAHRF